MEDRKESDGEVLSQEEMKNTKGGAAASQVAELKMRERLVETVKAPVEASLQEEASAIKPAAEEMRARKR
jgi:hypothetical protein